MNKIAVGIDLGTTFSAAAYIGLVRNDQGRRYLIYRNSGALIVISNGSNNGRNVFWIHSDMIENTERHQRSALRMIHTIDKVANIVHIRRNLSDFNIVL